MIGLDAATAIVDRALEKGRATGCAPLTVVVLDGGGHVVVAKREDGSGIMRFDIAFAKAWGALGLGVPSRTMAERARERPQIFDAFVTISGGRLFPAPGGVLVRDGANRIVGAVGVSGDTSDKDEICAVHAIAAAGLAADCGAPPAGE